MSSGAAFLLVIFWEVQMTYKQQLQNPLWQKKRLEIMQRDNFTCLMCNSNKHQLHIHHLYYEKNTEIYNYDNECYLTLCNICHDFFHSKLTKVISLIAFQIVKNKIDILELDNFLHKHQRKVKNQKKITNTDKKIKDISVTELMQQMKNN
jgi:5-methylcytosine-specific restriction endonuclease McrA